jgi:hypothetical protein
MLVVVAAVRLTIPLALVALVVAALVAGLLEQ